MAAETREFELTSLRELRERALNWVLVTSTTLGAFLLLAVLYELRQGGDSGMLPAFYIGLFILMCVFTFVRRLGYALRGMALVTLLYLIGITELWYYGVASMASFLMFSCVIFAGLLFGLRTGAVWLLAAVATYLAFVVLYTTGRVPVVLLQQEVSTQPITWVGVILTLVYISTTALVLLTFFLRSLGEQTQRSAELVESLSAEVAQRRKAEASLAESEMRYRLLAERGSEVIWEMDENFVVTYITPAVEKVFGYAPDEVIGRRVGIDILKMRSAAGLLDAMRAATGDSESQYSGEWELERANGEKIWCEVRSHAVIKAEGLRRYQGSLRDIDSRKRLEQQLSQSQKMEAVGQLAGGIAHDFNNLLMGIMGATEMISDDAAISDRSKTHLEVIRASSLRAASLIRQLLTFGRSRQDVSVPFDLHETIRQAKELLSHSLDKRIDLTLALNAEVPTVCGDPAQLESCVLNLCINARDAMPEGGTISIETWNCMADGPLLKEAPGLAERALLALSVRDTGCGIPDDQFERVFEPFYTTKALGKGTGLGLSSVFSCVQSHEGHVVMTSEVGAGTTFTLYLPTSTSVAEVDESASRERLGGAKARVLLVEDDDLLVEVIEGMLTAMGHEVRAYTDPVAAVKAYRKDPEDFDLALVDFNMPKMNGLQVLRELRDPSPGLTSILFTGMATDEVRVEAENAGASFVLPKPVTLRKLGEAIETALAAAVGD